MQSFENKLRFFKEQESITLSDKFDSQIIMSSQLAAERQKLLQEKKDKGPRVKPPPRNVSKNLYENPVSFI